MSAVKFVVLRGCTTDLPFGVFDTKALATKAIRTAGYRHNKEQDLFTKKVGGRTLALWIEAVSYNKLELSDGTE